VDEGVFKGGAWALVEVFEEDVEDAATELGGDPGDEEGPSAEEREGEGDEGGGDGDEDWRAEVGDEEHGPREAWGHGVVSGLGEAVVEGVEFASADDGFGEFVERDERDGADADAKYQVEGEVDGGGGLVGEPGGALWVRVREAADGRELRETVGDVADAGFPAVCVFEEEVAEKPGYEEDGGAGDEEPGGSQEACVGLGEDGCAAGHEWC